MISNENGADCDIEEAVLAYLQTTSVRATALLEKVASYESFGTESFDELTGYLNNVEQDFSSLPTSNRMEDILADFRPLAATYLKDLNSAKAILSLIFENFKIDKDLKTDHENLRTGVTEELQRLDSAAKQSLEVCEQYEMLRAPGSLESKLNYNCQDLKLAMWFLENQAAAMTQASSMHMIAGYFNLRAIVGETYNLLHMPGAIGHRVGYLKNIRSHLYG